jgi:peptidoglycan/xylan/chitin deacetylase (PgdA/CDA1 family)
MIERFARIAGVARKRTNAVGLILMYHRVGEFSPDPWRLAVSSGHFAEHLEVLRRCGHLLLLARAVEALRDHRLPGRTLVVTFDDGYADNLYNAKPLLERYDVPATVFLTTGYVGGDREFWWDALERVLLGPDVLPAELRLTASGRTSDLILGEARYHPGGSLRSGRQWSGAVSGRYELYRAVHRLLQPLGEVERQGVLDDLSAWAGVTLGVRASHRCLSADEVMSLTRGELIQAGCHTVSHAMLPALPEASQREEIRRSKLELEQLLGREVTSFAYPYGDYAAQTAALLHEEGFSSACSTRAGLLSQQSDPFCLPRIKVEDWDGEGLARILSEWFRS